VRDVDLHADRAPIRPRSYVSIPNPRPLACRVRPAEIQNKVTCGRINVSTGVRAKKYGIATGGNTVVILNGNGEVVVSAGHERSQFFFQIREFANLYGANA